MKFKAETISVEFLGMKTCGILKLNFIRSAYHSMIDVTTSITFLWLLEKLETQKQAWLSSIVSQAAGKKRS